ncbi:MAG TPA: NAD(P)-dependent oxidoreductase [Candidatus Baltobacteraceae bacterium]|jgi:uronate dehydrogenase|nr:NAD(P)-dependent oxidoreductase [Candidatus Baltobacteraceae bacterium]
MSKIAVTGSSGTIGKRLCADLAQEHELVRIDLEDADVHVDVREFAPLLSAFRGCETVIHLAGVVEVDADWESVYRVNIGGTYNAFEAARQAGVRRVIFASSNHCVGMHEVQHAPAIYEPRFGLVLRTDEPYRPDGLYGVWKAFGEVLGRLYSDQHGLQVACIRIGSITGADDPRDESVRNSSGWLNLTEAQKFKRYAATWMSQRDFARLIRAILASDVPYAVVYGVGDNLTRFWDLEPGRAIYGFWPQDGVR